ncbi:TetR/AcrR family transcriptional regulator [Kitasatospora sp. MAP5-34]|uniref:TetR/AcrR family transcriptional regulator n=1 Tax=Kitasatospora sp. MAP5-34 TaxID=3035102 RepID=UPI002473A606|nr:TetR/AcrR family transcriptional regulator [Kitasatospora sp. MAP5-34]MDH6578468.1 AcrR family transcriptional regulator [Kitasatospora sp. MAP5-34]
MTTVAAGPAAPRLRADASRNRARILTAAREAFVEHGADVPFDEIARRAGVGNATMYRNFADRRDLIHQVTLSVMARVLGHATEAMAEEADSFDALCRFAHAAADERIGALCPMVSDHVDLADPELEQARADLVRGVTELITRGQQNGRIRTDVGAGDFVIALSQLTRPLPGTACLDLDQFAHRHLQLLLDGLQAPARSPLPGRAATMEDFQRRS